MLQTIRRTLRTLRTLRTGLVRTGLVLSVGAAGVFAAASAGCGGGGKADATLRNPDGTVMTRGQALTRAEDLMMLGRNMKDRGETANDPDMVRKGEAAVEQGQQLKERAERMPAAP